MTAYSLQIRQEYRAARERELIALRDMRRARVHASVGRTTSHTRKVYRFEFYAAMQRRAIWQRMRERIAREEGLGL